MQARFSRLQPLIVAIFESVMFASCRHQSSQKGGGSDAEEQKHKLDKDGELTRVSEYRRL
jgi:hypothetical protein